ncbi:MAG: glycosyltransferase family 39 protein [Lewinellaceae bacterium]|nr:glycosyltransferase family 39 protein [Lewinellaceae bacterium]
MTFHLMTNSPLSQSRTWFITFVILLALGGFLRLLDITDPPLDFHPSRQLRNSLVARDIYYSILPSAATDQRDLAASFARSVGKYEPPVIESIVAYTYLATGENIAAARVWGTFFWLAAGIALFDLMRRATSPWAALIALAFYLVLPFSVQASRSFQPDPLMTSAFVIGIYFLYRWSEEQTWKWAILAGVFLGLATFVKIVIAFFVGAAAISLVLFTLGWNFWRSKQVWTMAAIMVVPALFYYVLLNQGRSTEYFFAWTVTLIDLITSTDFLHQVAGLPRNHLWADDHLPEHCRCADCQAAHEMAVHQPVDRLSVVWIDSALPDVYAQLLSYSTDPHSCAGVGSSVESAH